MVPLGWYSVFTDIYEYTVTADIWNPYQVFPLWHPSKGLIEVVHNYTVDKDTAEINLELMGAKIPNGLPAEVQVYNYWTMVGEVAKNTLVYNRTVVE